MSLHIISVFVESSTRRDGEILVCNVMLRDIETLKKFGFAIRSLEERIIIDPIEEEQSPVDDYLEMKDSILNCIRHEVEYFMCIPVSEYDRWYNLLEALDENGGVIYFHNPATEATHHFTLEVGSDTELGLLLQIKQEK